MKNTEVTQISTQISSAIWGLKGFAIVLIFFAHMPVDLKNGFIGYDILDYFFQLAGMSGVPIFLFLSGYLYKQRFSYRSKVKSLVIPLLVWGSIVWTSLYLIDYISIRSRFVFEDYITWIFGCGSYMYFVWILLLNMIICRYFPLTLITILSFISIILTELNVIPYNEYFTKYLNPLNFSVYFIIGIIFRKMSFLEKKDFSNIAVVILLLLLIVLIGLNIYVNNRFTYFNIISALISIITIIIASRYILCFDSKVLIRLGHYSFIIYLIHMPLANKLNSIFKVVNFWPIEFIKIILAITITFFIVLLCDKILTVFRWTKLKSALGFR